MPAPLGTTPTKKMPNIQVFGTADSPATRGALRFFRERRIVVRYVDLRKRPIARDELRRFTDRLGAAAVLAAGAQTGAGDQPADRPGEAMGLVERVRADTRLLRLPLVRYGDQVTAGPDEATWRGWLARPR